MDTPEITLVYWQIRGFGTPIASLLEYMQVPYTYKQYDDYTQRSQWFEDKKQLIQNGFSSPNLPYIHENSTNLRLAETFAILNYLSSKFKPSLAPSSGDEFTQFLYIREMLFKYNMALTYTAYWAKSKEEYKEMLSSALEDNAGITRYWVNTLDSNEWIMGKRLSCKG